jgi:hypothetical protein
VTSRPGRHLCYIAGAVRAVLLALLLALVSAVPAQAQDVPVAPAAPRVIVLVVDPGRVRMSSERLGRALSRTLLRDVVRITDDRARDAAGTLTIAHDSGQRWHVRFESRGRAATVVQRVTRPGAIDLILAEAARRAVDDVEARREPASAPARPGRDAAASMYLAWADEILDPFADMPPPPRREMAIFSEVIDPFAPAASRHRTFTEVLDPWGR